MNQKRIRVTVDKKGNFTLEAKDGFAGESCVQETQELEVAIGGTAVDEGKTDDYWRGDDDPIRISID